MLETYQIEFLFALHVLAMLFWAYFLGFTFTRNRENRHIASYIVGVSAIVANAICLLILW